MAHSSLMESPGRTCSRRIKTRRKLMQLSIHACLVTIWMERRPHIFSYLSPDPSLCWQNSQQTLIFIWVYQVGLYEQLMQQCLTSAGWTSFLAFKWNILLTMEWAFSTVFWEVKDTNFLDAMWRSYSRKCMSIYTL